MSRHSSFRRVTRAIAVWLLLVGPSEFQHVGQDDFACAPAGLGESAADRTIGAPRSDTAEHCLVCHWTRSLRSPSATVTRVTSTFVAGDAVEPRQAVPHRAPALDQSPARAPPATLE